MKGADSNGSPRILTPSVKSVMTQMCQDAFGDSRTQGNWHSITDQPPDDLEARANAWSDESIILREGLQGGGLAQRERPVLFGVAETAASESVALGRERRCGFVPSHAPIDTGIGLSRPTSMTGSHQVTFPIPPASTRARLADAFTIVLAELAGPVQGIVGIRITIAQSG